MKKTIDDALLQERIDAYLEKHWDEVIMDIDKRISNMFSKIVRELFSSGYRGESTVEKLLKEKISNVAEEVINSTEIDKAEIERLVKKKIENQVKKLQVDIDLH